MKLIKPAETIDSFASISGPSDSCPLDKITLFLLVYICYEKYYSREVPSPVRNRERLDLVAASEEAEPGAMNRPLQPQLGALLHQGIEMKPRSSSVNLNAKQQTLKIDSNQIPGHHEFTRTYFTGKSRAESRKHGTR